MNHTSRPVDLSRAAWRKSSYSGDQGNCVEVADLVSDTAVRDSKNPTGPALVFPSDGWSSFVTAVKGGVLYA